ncbi:hypothetical protein H0H93_013770, partial [Arthromyces matolae]
ILLTTKPQLDDPKPPTRPTLTTDLHRVASLAESFLEQRPKSNDKKWVDLADTLDQEGVNLWNISGLIRRTSEDDGRSLVAALRLAAFRLIESGVEVNPEIESLLHILQLASKTGTTLSEIGKHDIAARVLTSAAKYEELLRNVDDPDGVHRTAIACAAVVYFSSRMEARQLLASKFHRIGKSMLEQPEGTKSSDAVLWLQKSFTLADPLEDKVAPGVAELKALGLFWPLLMIPDAFADCSPIARAYFVAGSYDRAEATLEELIPTIDASPGHEGSGYRELRWLRLATLKRRKAGETALLHAFKSIVDHMEFSETNVTDILQDLRTIHNHHTLVTAVHQYCLEKGLACRGTGDDCVDRLLLSLIFHCAKDEDHERALKTIDMVFDSLCQAEVELATIPTTACLTLVWQYGDRHYHAKKWAEAADWYLAGSHKLFRPSNPTASAKCYRKAALCYIEQRDFARAATVIRRCPTNEAKTHYVMFTIAVHQGLEDEGSAAPISTSGRTVTDISPLVAIRAVREMVDASDFDRSMLLLATQLSHQSEMKSVLLSVLQALLKTLKLSNSGETVVEAMTLIRCIIRLALSLLSEPTANRTLAEAACSEKAMSLISKDVSWLWRTAYNCAVQGCSEWERCEERIANLFDIARALLEALCQASPVEMDPDIYSHLVNASFSAVAGHGDYSAAILRSVMLTKVQYSLLAKQALLQTAKQAAAVKAEIVACKMCILSVMGKGKVQKDEEVLRMQYFIHTLQVFQAEFLARTKLWDQVPQLVQEIVNSGPLALGTYEAIADILVSPLIFIPFNTDHNVYSVSGSKKIALSMALLRASLDHNHLSVEKFSRWLRAICTIILARNASEDRAKAIGYIEQALAVIEDSHDSDQVRTYTAATWLMLHLV